MDVVIDDMQVAGVKEKDAEDRKRWRQLLRCVDPQWEKPKEEDILNNLELKCLMTLYTFVSTHQAFNLLV